MIRRVANIARRINTSLWTVRRKLAADDQAVIDNYFQTASVRKLHIGCGETVLDGWLNTDYEPRARNAVFIDATAKYPFADDCFDYIYSEHMIEHISYPQGRQMLRECFRVLKTGGRIRVVTPNLSAILDLYRPDKSKIQQDYIDWSTKSFIPHAPWSADTFVINNFVRNWGHIFIYDEKILRSSMEQAGFAEITRCELNMSTDSLLSNLEHAERLPDGFLALESLTLEATKEKIRP